MFALLDCESSGGRGNVADAGDGTGTGCAGCIWFLRRGSLLATVFASRGSRARRGSRGRAGAADWDEFGLRGCNGALADWELLCLEPGKDVRSGGVDPVVSLPTRS